MSPRFKPSKTTLPSVSDTLPVVVPFTITDAPVTGPRASSTTHVTLPVCWEILVLGSAGVVPAKVVPGEASVPASRIKLTKFNFFRMEI